MYNLIFIILQNPLENVKTSFVIKKIKIAFTVKFFFFFNSCNFRCEDGRYGINCENVCQCKNNALCDKETGKCICLSGKIKCRY